MKIFKHKHVHDENCTCNEHCHCSSHTSATCTCNCSADCDCGCQSGSECTCGDSCNCADKCECKDESGGSDDGDVPRVRCINNCSAKNCGCKYRPNDKNIKKLKSRNLTSGCSCDKCIDKDIIQVSNDKVNIKQLSFNISRIVISALLIIIGSIVKMPDYVNLALFIPAYLFIGAEYLYKACRNILKGKIFDENFLMVLATVGAFAIGEYLEAVLVMELYFIGEMLQDYAVDSSRRNISDLLNIKAPQANRLVGNTLVSTPTEELQVGDIIRVAAGEKVAVDGIVIEGSGYLDTSALTGESKLAGANINDTVQGGVINTSGALTLKVTKRYQDTSVAKILLLIQEAQDKKPVTEKFITKFAKYYTPIVVLVAAIIAFIPPLFLGFSDTFIDYINKALVFLVISCPCALVISIPLGFFAGIGGASRKGILVKGGNHFESVNNIEYYLFDKTGTLTEGIFDVIDTHAVEEITDTELLELAAYAEHSSNHPIAQSIMKNYNGEIDLTRVSEYEEISGYGISLILDNNVILCGKSELLTQHGISVNSTNNNGNSVIHLSRDNQYMGYIVLGDKIKDEAQPLIHRLLSDNKKVILLSGDNESAVKNVADKVGITEYHYGLLPEDKAQIVENLINSNHKVAFIGDGLNDAPVLKLATLGICMSGLSNDASIEASDIVISGGKVGLVGTLIDKAKNTRKIVTENIIFSLAVKLAIMIISVTVFASMWLAILADVGVSLLAILNSLRAKK